MSADTDTDREGRSVHIVPWFRFDSDVDDMLRSMNIDVVRFLVDDSLTTKQITFPTAATYETEHVAVNLENYDEVFNGFTAGVRSHPDDDCYLCLSSGTNMATIAGFVACSLLDRHYEVNIYAASGWHSEQYRRMLDVFDIDDPTDVQIGGLKAIRQARSPLTKGELIEELCSMAVDFENDGVKEKAMYRRLDRHVVKPLIERGAIDVRKQGRTRTLTLTEYGVDLISMYGWMVEV